MKRFILILLVAVSLGWLGYASYDLFIDNSNQLTPEHVFCKEEQAVILVNRISESEDVLSIARDNVYAPVVPMLDSLSLKIPDLRIFLSASTNKILFKKDTDWSRKEAENITQFFKQNNVHHQRSKNNLLISDAVFKSPDCRIDSTFHFFQDADKKASANYWEKSDDGWNRTDIYNLDKGYFEYRSADPNTTYGKPIRDVPYFASVIPENIDQYIFRERFYASAHDTIFSQTMASWVDKGFVDITYKGERVLFSDYRSKQEPSLILIEKSTHEDSIKMHDNLHSFTGFQLTNDFPASDSSRIYVGQLEDKVFFTENRRIAQQILVDYQLGRTIATQKKVQKAFFGGLPAEVNYRSISPREKKSNTWKSHLLFQVSTRPPKAQVLNEDNSTWSYSPAFKLDQFTPIPDHLRNGTSLFIYDDQGNYELLGPNSISIWSGSIGNNIQGQVKVVDVFDNDKHQLLFRTENKVHLIDLNGNSVGGFPYKSEHQLTSAISAFVWNGTKRFLVGTKKGEVVMINSSGQELNIIQVSSQPIDQTPFALNIDGNLRTWVIDSEARQFMGYLETPAAAERLGKTSGTHFVKHQSEVVGYYTKNEEVFALGHKDAEANFRGKGKLKSVDDQYAYIQSNNTIKVLNHDGEMVFTIGLPYNEVSHLKAFEANNTLTLIALDYLQNKIHAYDKLQQERDLFPKEGRTTVRAQFDENRELLYLYTEINGNIICYKLKIGAIQ